MLVVHIEHTVVITISKRVRQTFFTKSFQGFYVKIKIRRHDFEK
jgi:hypothetical protein